MSKRGERSLTLAGLLFSGAFLGLGLLLYFASEGRINAPVLYFSIIGLLTLGIYFNVTHHNRKRRKAASAPFPEKWRDILDREVAFYRGLDQENRKKFEKDVMVFLAEKRITPIDTEIDDTDRLLVASSAVIPVFWFDEWEYHKLDEVLIYPGSFNNDFETDEGNRNILGMVGSGGAMDRVMILSKTALRQGFENANNKNNTAIHEFIHLIDKEDGTIDGVPRLLLSNQYMIPWIDLIDKNIRSIMEGKSDIREYAAMNRQEFFAVVSEYFFKQPEMLEKKHPELYKLLDSIFRQDIKTVLKRSFRRKRIPRNAPCPCGSGKKYKRCCGLKKGKSK